MTQKTNLSSELYHKVEQAQQGEINALEILHIDGPKATFTPLPTAANKPPSKEKL